MLDQSLNSDDHLVSQAKTGDRSAYSELVIRHYESVIRVVFRLCGEAQLAQDVAQETFIKAWVKLAGYQVRSSFRCWLYRIAINAALDILRQKKDESLEDSEEIRMMADKNPGPEAAYIEKEQVDFLQGVVRSLPDAARSVLVLREYGDLSYEEIASVLEIPIGTVMSRLSYARSRLREVLKNYQLEMEHEYA